MVENFLKQTNGWCNSYCTITVCDSFISELRVKSALALLFGRNWENECYNGEIEDGKITFEVAKGEPRFIAKQLSKMLKCPVYGDTSWDYHELWAYKDGESYDNYTAVWNESEPKPYWDEDDEHDNCPSDAWYDCDVKITDNETNASFVIGGGMCEPHEFRMYKRIIANHSPKLDLNVYVTDVSVVKRTKNKEIYLCFATCNNIEYEFFVYYDIKEDNYIFYYKNGIKPDYVDFEHKIIYSGLVG